MITLIATSQKANIGGSRLGRISRVITACFVVSTLEGRSQEDALRRACAAGAIAASRFGAQTSLPTAAEVDALL